ncbi:MAG: twin-arginine translocase TatA/TatE family subunit [Planctomycetia bacterium]|nr:twin-arginine translocase TatA/TatE family subunit [Planctomycetia bacterium]
MMTLPLAFMGIGAQELLIIGGIALLLFGTRLPAVARSFGQSVVEFKKGMRDIDDEVKADLDDDKADQKEKQSQDS